MAVFCQTGTGADLTATGFSGDNAAIREDIVNNLVILSMAEQVARIEAFPTTYLLDDSLSPPEKHVAAWHIGQTYLRQPVQVRFVFNTSVAYTQLIGQVATYTRRTSDGLRMVGPAAVLSIGGPAMEEAGRIQVASLMLQFLHTVTVS